MLQPSDHSLLRRQTEGVEVLQSGKEEEALREISLWPFNTRRELIQKMKRDFLQGIVVTGKGLMFLNCETVNWNQI